MTRFLVMRSCRDSDSQSRALVIATLNRRRSSASEPSHRAGLNRWRGISQSLDRPVREDGKRLLVRDGTNTTRHSRPLALWTVVRSTVKTAAAASGPMPGMVVSRSRWARKGSIITSICVSSAAIIASR